MLREYTWQQTKVEGITSLDLQAAAKVIRQRGGRCRAYCITVWEDGRPHIQRAQMLIAYDTSMYGITWGADADWEDRTGRGIGADIKAMLG